MRTFPNLFHSLESAVGNPPRPLTTFSKLWLGKPNRKAKQKRKAKMAQYHAHLKSISRADGRSATGAIYRAACKIVDDRTGLEFDFTKKGVEHSQIFFPPGEENTRLIYTIRLRCGTKLKKMKLSRMHKLLVSLSFHFHMS